MSDPSVRRSPAIVLLAILLALGAVACRTAPMSRPATVPSALPPEENRELIRNAMAVLGWQADSEAPGEVLARHQRGSYFARVRIRYDETGISFDYVDSQNLRCTEGPGGCTTIHKTYNRWVDSLHEGIRGLVAARRPPPLQPL